MKLNTLMLLGIMLSQPGWLLADDYGTWWSMDQQTSGAAHVNQSVDPRSTPWSDPWNDLRIDQWDKPSYIQEQAPPPNVITDIFPEAGVFQVSSNRHGRWNGHSKRYKRPNRKGLRGGISIRFGHKRYSPNHYSHFRYYTPKKRYHHRKRWSSHTRKYRHYRY